MVVIYNYRKSYSNLTNFYAILRWFTHFLTTTTILKDELRIQILLGQKQTKKTPSVIYIQERTPPVFQAIALFLIEVSLILPFFSPSSYSYLHKLR